MDPVWTRIDSELKARGKGPQWLADEIGYSIQRVHNWKSRGVPPSAFADVAAALGWSIDRLLGGGESESRVMEGLTLEETSLLRAFRRLPTALARSQVASYIDGLMAGAAQPGPARKSETLAEYTARMAHKEKAADPVPSIERRFSDRLVKRHPLRRAGDKESGSGK